MESFWQAREMRKAAKDLERAARSRKDLEPAVADRITRLVERQKEINAKSSPQVLNEIERELDDLNALFTSGSHAAERRADDGTMVAMERERIQQQAARLGDRLRDPTTPADEQQQIAAELSQLNSQLKNLPTGDVQVNLYRAQHTLEDLQGWYGKLKNPTAEQTADYQTAVAELGGYVKEAQRRFNGSVRDSANTVLSQARLTREQVERELIGAIEKDKKMKKGDVVKFSKGWRYWTRNITQVIGGGLGATGGGAIANTLASVGTVALTPFLLKALAVAGLVGTGALAGTAVFRYAPKVVPWGPLSGRALRAEQADVRSRKALKDTGKLTAFEQTLRTNVGNENTRTQQMSALIQQEYGGLGKQFLRGFGKVVNRAVIGSATATVVAGGAAYYNNPDILTGSGTLRKAGALGSGILEQMGNAAHAIGVLYPLVNAFDSASDGIKWLLAQPLKLKFW